MYHDGPTFYRFRCGQLRRSELDDHTNQLNPNNDAYRRAGDATKETTPESGTSHSSAVTEDGAANR